ncbi:hypothetical protein [Variovorax ginsengisoli]|uniref:Recombinase n=1 Tax=Variovorax ginsengisoli TaxID=363844 RepID=A0ABT8SDM5_9BURK|nr:hypothetical protein [Variovorax ginsengisoli]MDN8617843.1 hypothetical protein [Variovorax ginsengisoli]MDO1537013.1 hypothetical protein [Variovorax ginsengisoli]
MTTRSILVASPRAAHEAVVDLYQNVIKEHTRTGAAGILTWETVDQYHRHQLRKMFHGPILKDIAEQVWLWDGRVGERVRYAPLVWKAFFAEMFIEPEFEEYTVRATGEMKVRQRRRSTEALSDDKFALFVLQVCAFACTELGVEFIEMEPQQ